MHVDLTNLRIFRDVAEAGSITGGAARNRLALAAASTRIRGLESDVGAPLLTRSRNGVTLTAPGHGAPESGGWPDRWPMARVGEATHRALRFGSGR
jgi:Bacterial regulatory helix-turn-helix protein, lysR family